MPSDAHVLNNTFGRSYTYGTHVYVAPSTEWAGNRVENGGPLPR